MGLIKYCRIAGGNFGDDINLQLWKRLFPNLEELTGRVFFYGVGTLLDGRHDPSMRKVVLGAGIGEYNVAMPDSNWDFRWVRGPMTAIEFGLPADSAIGDSAILWPELTSGHDEEGPIGLIPHYATCDSYDWVDVAATAGTVLINPRQEPNAVISQMRGCSRILAESLHGAICADAMAIPWAACILTHRFNEFKWRDWLATIGRQYQPLVVDRPLVREITPVKAYANRLARLVQYKRKTRYPALRPVAPATAQDAWLVSQALKKYGNRETNFYCSEPETIERQRRLMHMRCKAFAREYGLDYSLA